MPVFNEKKAIHDIPVQSGFLLHVQVWREAECVFNTKKIVLVEGLSIEGYIYPCMY